jgi:NarL family two-component system response regulator LiaR
LILTAFDDEPYIRAVLQAGANGYVLETAEAHEIVEAVQAVHEGQSILDPIVARKLVAHLADPNRDNAELPVESLTERELEVLRLTAKGCTNKAIGADFPSVTVSCKDSWQKFMTSSTPPAAPKR